MKNKKLIIILLVVSITMITIGGLTIYSSSKGKNTSKFDITDTTSFFIQNNEEKYALFNETGKQLTKFIYTSSKQFINQTAVVEIDEKTGIISASGEVVVEIGKYDSIYSSGGLYKVTKKNKERTEQYLIDSKGEVLYDLENKDIVSSSPSQTYLILNDKEKEKYIVVNFLGKEILTIPKVKDVDTPTTNETDNYISVFYNNKNWIFNVVTGKEIEAFESNLHYCVNDVSDDEKTITLNSCVAWYEEQEKVYYKFINNGKLYDLTDKCDLVYYADYHLACKKNDSKYLLTSDFELGIKYEEKSYIDNENYVMESIEEDGVVDFYKNGKKVKSVPCMHLKSDGYNKTGIVLLYSYTSRKCGDDFVYEYYDLNGNKLFNKSFTLAREFSDTSGYAQVSTDEVEYAYQAKNFYLIDKTGKQVLPALTEYTIVSSLYDHFIVEKDGLKGIVDKNGKEIIPSTYYRIQSIDHIKEDFVYLITKDYKYIIYDLKKEKQIAQSDYSPTVNTHYIQVSQNGIHKYYTHSGVLFYENK